MSRQLKIGADTSEIKKSILELSRSINKDLGKSKIELFTPETKKLLRGEAIAQAEALKRQIDAIKESTKKHAQAMQDVVKGSKEELKLKEKILKASQHIAKLSKDQSKVENLSDELKPTKGGFMGGLAKALQKIPGYGKIAGMAGMGAMGGAGLLAGGALIGAGAYGISRVMSARQTYAGGIDTRLRLRGRGVADMAPTNTQDMLSAGLNSLTLRESRLRDMDVFGREGASQANVIKRAQFERNFGIEEGTLSGFAGSFRSSMGGKGANQTLMKLQASLIASGISDAIGPYLETAAAMLTDINEKGFTMDESVTSLFNSMLKLGMGEGRVSKLMTGADAGIRGASGEANAFFQNVFGKAGIGGGTIGGAQAAMRMGGLFGVDLDKYKAMSGTDRKAFETLGIGGTNHMQNVAGATVSQLDKLFGSDAEINKQLGSTDQRTQQGGALKRLSRLRYVMQAFGLKDEGQASEVEGLLKKAATASPEEQKNIMRKVQDIKESTPELENLKKINSSNEGIFNILKNEKETIEDAIGEATSAAFNKMNELLNSIDKAILAIAKFLTGYESDDERLARQKQEQVEQGEQGKKSMGRLKDGNLSAMQYDLRQMNLGNTWEENQEFAEMVKKKKDENKDKGFWSKDRRWESIYESEDFKPMRMGLEAKERRRMREAAAGQNSTVSTPVQSVAQPAPGGMSTPVNELTKQQLEQQKLTNRLLQTVGRNTKERGTLKPGSGSTTGR